MGNIYQQNNENKYITNGDAMLFFMCFQVTFLLRCSGAAEEILIVLEFAVELLI